MVQEGNLSKQSSEIVAEMSLKEKAVFCSGKNFWYLKSLDRSSCPRLWFPMARTVFINRIVGLIMLVLMQRSRYLFPHRVCSRVFLERRADA